MELTFVCRNTSSACNSAVVMARLKAGHLTVSLVIVFFATGHSLQKQKKVCQYSWKSFLIKWNFKFNRHQFLSRSLKFRGTQEKACMKHSECWGRLFAGVIACADVGIVSWSCFWWTKASKCASCVRQWWDWAWGPGLALCSMISILPVSNEPRVCGRPAWCVRWPTDCYKTNWETPLTELGCIPRIYTKDHENIFSFPVAYLLWNHIFIMYFSKNNVFQ